jgi:nitrogen regulatory protein PII
LGGRINGLIFFVKEFLHLCQELLHTVEVNLMTVTNVLAQGRQKGFTEIYRGVKEVDGLLRKVRLDIAVNEDFVEPTIAAINHLSIRVSL